MQDFEERRHEVKESVKRFEMMLKSRERQFFDLDTYEQIVEHYIIEGNAPRALEACDMGLEYYPYSLDLMLDKAQLLSQKQKFEEALQVIENATLFNPNDIDVLFMKGGILAAMDDYQEAVIVYEQLLQYVDEAEQEDVLFQIGQTYQNWSKYADAIHFYKKILAQNIDHESAIFELSFCADITEKLDDCINFLRQQIDRHPYSYTTWYHLGIAYSKKNEYANAIEAYEYAVAIKEDFSSAFFNIAHTYMNMGNYEKAIENYLITLTQEGPSAELACHLGASYEKSGNLVKAIEFFREAIKIDADSDEGWYGVAACLALEHKWVEALNCVRRAIRLNEFEADYWITAAELEYKIGNVFSSYEAFERAETLDPEHLDLWLKWSLVLFDQGQYDEATELVQNGLDQLPDTAELYYRATAYMIYAGKYQDALINLEIALTLNYELKDELFTFFPELEKQKALHKLIEQYKP